MFLFKHEMLKMLFKIPKPKSSIELFTKNLSTLLSLVVHLIVVRLLKKSLLVRVTHYYNRGKSMNPEI